MDKFCFSKNTDEENRELAEKAIKDFLEANKIDTNNQHLIDTPKRVAKAWKDCFLSGYEMDVNNIISVEFSAEHYDQMVIVSGIPFASLCAHHLVPFIGTAKVGYLPRDGKITGLSKLARIVEMFARRLQIQEQMTQQIAEALQEKLNPVGVGVVLEAEHMCMTIRGIQKPGSLTKTSCLLGNFREDPAVRHEFLSL